MNFGKGVEPFHEFRAAGIGEEADVELFAEVAGDVGDFADASFHGN